MKYKRLSGIRWMYMKKKLNKNNEEKSSNDENEMMDKFVKEYNEGKDQELINYGINTFEEDLNDLKYLINKFTLLNKNHPSSIERMKKQIITQCLLMGVKWDNKE